MIDYYLSSPMATGLVTVNSKGLIIETPPIWKRFQGQQFDRLKGWLISKFSEELVQCEALEDWK